MSDYQKFINKNAALFWSVSPQNRMNISDILLVETILNYGTLESVQELFDLIGIDKTASIFFDQTHNNERHNYFPEVENFFRLYFKNHVPQYSER